MCIFLYLNGCSDTNGPNRKNNQNATKDKTAQTAAAEIQSTPQIEKPVTPQTQDQLPAEKVAAAKPIQQGENLEKSDDVLGSWRVKISPCSVSHLANIELSEPDPGCFYFVTESGAQFEEACGIKTKNITNASSPLTEPEIQKCRKKCDILADHTRLNSEGYKNPVLICAIKLPDVGSQGLKSRGGLILPQSSFHVIGTR